jgi:hypothetical protein
MSNHLSHQAPEHKKDHDILGWISRPWLGTGTQIWWELNQWIPTPLLIIGSQTTIQIWICFYFQNSVRHNLSLNKCFAKVDTPKLNGNAKKGCLWALNPEKIEKMEEEIAKHRKKDLESIKISMAMPGKYFYLNTTFLSIPLSRINILTNHICIYCVLYTLYVMIFRCCIEKHFHYKPMVSVV